MKERLSPNQDERLMASLAHGGVLVGMFTSGLGGILLALVIWLTQKEKSAYLAFQSLQALVYQVIVFLLTTLAFACWGMLWLMMMFPALVANSSAYQSAPPPVFWVGLSALICPLVFYFAVVAYGLWAAVRCFSGHDFRYVFIGNWLDRQ